MKIDVSYLVADASLRAMFEAAGVPLKDDAETLKRSLCRALVQGAPDEKLTVDDKLTRYVLTQKITAAAGEIDLTAEEISALKKLLGGVYIPVFFGRLSAMLEAGVLPLAEKAT